jgi:hypothetical protein
MWTVAPARANLSTAAAPMPLFAPVTMTDQPASAASGSRWLQPRLRTP